MRASAVTTPGFSSCAQLGSVALWHVGSSLSQGSNPCLLCWQADSLPLSHQGNLVGVLKMGF